MALDELIIKYLKGELNLKEQRLLVRRLKDEDVNPIILKKIKLFWEDPKHSFIEERDEVYQSIFKKIGDIDEDQAPVHHPNGYEKQSKRYLWLAAAITLLAVMFFTDKVNRNSIPDASPVVNEVRKTMAGQKLQVHLRDGSQVKLNAESRIEFPKYFSDSSRLVRLKGEAYFEVAEDASKPFEVSVGDIVVKALGTSFNIKNVPGSSKVYLTSGKVAVSSPGIEKEIILTPGKMVIEKNGFLSEISDFDYVDVAWKDNVLIFEDASISQVLKRLEKWYGVDIHIKGEVAEWSFSGQFDNEPLKEVLTGISHSEKFDFDIQNKEVLIKPKR